MNTKSIAQTHVLWSRFLVYLTICVLDVSLTFKKNRSKINNKKHDKNKFGITNIKVTKKQTILYKYYTK